MVGMLRRFTQARFTIVCRLVKMLCAAGGAALRGGRAGMNMDRRLLGLGIASIWLLTGTLVLHPYFRAVGGTYLDRWGLPHALMIVTCAFELILGAWVLLGRMTPLLAGIQLAMIG